MLSAPITAVVPLPHEPAIKMTFILIPQTKIYLMNVPVFYIHINMCSREKIARKMVALHHKYISLQIYTSTAVRNLRKEASKRGLNRIDWYLLNVCRS